MNIYDTKSIDCVICGKTIGEIDYDAYVIRPMCGHCHDPKPDIKDSMPKTSKKIDRPEEKAIVTNC